MDVVKAEKFIRELYDRHQPDRTGACDGDHDVTGMEYDQPNWAWDEPCMFHTRAASILGLPVATWERPPREEPTNTSPIVAKSYEQYVERVLRSTPILRGLAEPTGQTVFKIVKE